MISPQWILGLGFAALAVDFLLGAATKAIEPKTAGWAAVIILAAMALFGYLGSLLRLW